MSVIFGTLLLPRSVRKKGRHLAKEGNPALLDVARPLQCMGPGVEWRRRFGPGGSASGPLAPERA